MLILKFDNNIRTRTTYRFKIQFGRVLPEKELYSFSFFKNQEIVTVIFKEKLIENWYFDEDNNLKGYKQFGLSHNLPIADAEIKIEKEENDIIEFFSTDKRGSSGNWSIGDYKKNKNGVIKLTFSRVETFLGYNVAFDFTKVGNLITETKKFKWNYTEKGMELIGAFQHEYEFQYPEVEKIAQNILTLGWNDKDVRIELQKIKI